MQLTPASLALIFIATLERYWSLGCPRAPIPVFGDDMHWLGIPRKESVARFTSGYSGDAANAENEACTVCSWIHSLQYLRLFKYSRTPISGTAFSGRKPKSRRFSVPSDSFYRQYLRLLAGLSSRFARLLCPPAYRSSAVHALSALGFTLSSC
jgi:hypothetical protein